MQIKPQKPNGHIYMVYKSVGLRLQKWETIAVPLTMMLEEKRQLNGMLPFEGSKHDYEFSL